MAGGREMRRPPDASCVKYDRWRLPRSRPVACLWVLKVGGLTLV